MIHRNGNAVVKTDDQPVTYSDLTDINYNANGTVNSSVTYTHYPMSKHERRIVYTTRPKGNRSKANMCIQSSTDLDCTLSSSSGVYTPLNPDGTYVYQSPSTLGISFYPIVLSKVGTGLTNIGTGVLGAKGQGYINDAFGDTKPDLTEISLPNFLLELDDIPRMFNVWKKDLSLLRNLANARLNWSFGWKPFVSDTESILSVIKSVRDKLKAWNSKVGELMKRSKTFHDLSTSASGSTGDYGGGWTIYWSVSRQYSLKAFLTYKLLRIQAVESALTIMRAYLDAFGFELNPRIVWDAIPFSFVLDWFFDVGGWLQHHKYDTLELPIVLDDSYLQYKEELTISYYGVNSSSSYSPPLRTQTFKASVKTFQRLPIFPDQSAATAHGWRIPSGSQLTNLISLIITR